VVQKLSLRLILLLVLFAGSFYPAATVSAAPPSAGLEQSAPVTAYDLIIAMNTLRVSYGLSALVEDPIINAVAQSTAEIMAASQMSWHIGDVSGRLAAAGYGGGAKVWATENFAVGSNSSIDQIMLTWSDDSHMIPAVNPAYCNVGAGVATSPNGMTYYVLQAAYLSTKACGEYKSPSSPSSPGSSTGGNSGGVSQIIVPVKIATPDAEGKIFHVVEAGQSFWSIAVAYKITIKDLETWNNLTSNSPLRLGQRLFIPSGDTVGYITPTPVGMVQISPPGPDGKIIHTVAVYQTLTTISQAYGVEIAKILSLNGIQADWPLQIGQKLVISLGTITPSPTPRPLTAVEKLTPASDGRYYHEIESGQTLSWIAALYDVALNDLMSWNGLNNTSIIRSGEKLVLQVTPPATPTFTPSPVTPSATLVPRTATRAPTQTLRSPTPTPDPPAPGGGAILWLGLALPIAAAGFFLMRFYLRRKSP